MTKFIESFTTRQMLTPWTTSASRSWLFLARVPTPNVKNYLADFFNSAGPDRAPYHYEPWADPCFGFLTLVEHGNFMSDQWGHANDRRLSHRELIWTFPTARYRRTEDNLLVEKTLVWLQPFYFDDNSYVTFSSREIWGGDKGMADILVADGSTARDFHMDIDLHGFSTYNPRSHVHAIGGVHIRGGPYNGAQTSAHPVKEPSKDGPEQSSKPDSLPPSQQGPVIDPLKKFIADDLELSAFVKSFEGILPASWSIADPSKHFDIPDIVLNSVKQYRDANNYKLAAYRAIVESRVSHSGQEGFDYLPGNRVDLRFMWSDSFKEQLQNLFGLTQPQAAGATWGHVGKGLRIDDKGVDWDLEAVKLDVRLALHFYSDAKFHVDRVLHAYGDSPYYDPGKCT